MASNIKVLLKLDNVCKTYQLDGIQVPAVYQVNLEIKAGELVSIVGPSGSGKSTLMHLIGCLDRPTTGAIYLQNQDISKLTDNQLAAIRNKEIGFIFQSYNLLARTSALANVAMPLIYAGIGENQRQKMAKQKLEEVGLADRLYHLPNQLSGGQQQRVAIARALINNPNIILADEPTGNLDTKSGAEIISILKKLNQAGHTIIIVTHDPNIAKQAKRIIRMQDGKVI